jgi:pyridoxamine 5'-phosphate oxidase
MQKPLPSLEMKISDLRKDYVLMQLSTEDTLPDPIAQFNKWLSQALTAELPEPTAMTLSTADAQGRPSARIVLLKQVDEAGFTFYTHYESRKAQQMQVQPYVALTFHWTELERQVRIEGRAEKVSAAQSEAYFHSRPRESQLGAWTSPQSQPIASRTELEEAFAGMQLRFGEGPIPLPPHWGGYLVRPERVEFWQGRASRLHDRICYVLEEENWKKCRLAP